MAVANEICEVMTAILENVINALRDELQQYGEMLAVLDQQQEAGRARGAHDLVSTIHAVNRQSATIQLSRQTRESWQRRLALALCQPEDSRFATLFPLLPEHYRPLVNALVEENNELLMRVRTRAQENQLMLSQSLDMMQRFLSSLSPQDHPPRMAGDETDLITGSASDSLYEAIA